MKMVGDDSRSEVPKIAKGTSQKLNSKGKNSLKTMGRK